MKLTILICFACLGSALAQTNVAAKSTQQKLLDFQSDPIRYFPNSKVDLTPLIVWWTNAAAALARKEPIPNRPLPAWVRITSSSIKDTPYGWEIEGVVSEGPKKNTNQKFLLWHPLKDEKFRYEEFQAKYVANVNSSRLGSIKTESAAKLKASLPRYNAPKLTMPELDNLVKEWLAMRVPSSNGVYQIDILALRVGKIVQGLPLYDLGAIQNRK